MAKDRREVEIVGYLDGKTVANYGAEKGLIGALLWDASQIDDVFGIITPECLRGPYATAVAMAWQMHQENQAISLASLVTRLQQVEPKAEGAWDRSLTEAFEAVPHAGHILHFARLVLESHQRHKGLCLATEFMVGIHEHPDLETIVSKLSFELSHLMEGSRGTEATNSRDGINQVIRSWNTTREKGIPTGFPGIDEKISGLQPGRFYIIGAATGVGKSALAGNIGWNVAKYRSVLFLALEMAAEEVYERGALFSLRKAAWEIKNAYGSGGDELAIIKSGLDQLQQRMMHVDDRGSQTIAKISAQARKHKKAHGLDLLIVDHIGLVTPSDTRVARYEQLGGISRGLKLLAKNLNIPVLALCQLNRAANAEGVKPQLHNLRESGNLEQDADVVMFLYRAKEVEKGEDPNATDLIIAKNRSGPTGVVKMIWRGEYVSYDEAARDSGEDFDPCAAFGGNYDYQDPFR